MLKKLLTGISLLALPLSASASLITDTNNNSFIDNSQNLEWMDFGQNNLLTYNQVNDLINSPANTDNWRLATEEQAISLWTSLFYDKGATFNIINHDNNLLMNLSDYTDKRLHWNLYEIMGYNIVHAKYDNRDIGTSRGLVANDVGGLTSFNFGNNPRGSSQVSVENHKSTDQFYKTHTSEYYSTLLVKDYKANNTVSVPEPSTLIILIFGFAGLLIRKFSK
ncbi:PEP-CTERM sorting domain-containing protein [Thalassotalea sp. PLHSN55]|uniref:PEP-CTERM sorting domain-containing protein n=1 Tax=Thalassotalea sp. PLHSN55 TaxID=3435888 RepID=UPI003F82BA8F